jgi:hypothetical protein
MYKMTGENGDRKCLMYKMTLCEKKQPLNTMKGGKLWKKGRFMYKMTDLFLLKCFVYKMTESNSK